MAEDRAGIDYLLGKFEGKTDGYLVDIGAHDGVEKGSMTRELVLQGWGGLMVEPLPSAFALLEKAYRDTPSVNTLHMACSNSNGTAELFPCKGVSTLSPEWAAECSAYWKHVKYGKPIKVQKRTLVNLLELVDAPQHINLLQIDTEGHDLAVLQGMDWNRTVDVICVETLDMVNRDRKIGGLWHPSPELNKYLSDHGYELVLLTPGGNGFYERKAS